MTIAPIATVRSCFGAKFAVPRQPGLCPSAWGRLVFHPEYRSLEAVRGIEGFSHLWLIFGFHETVEQGWKPTVRPPRLGGNQRVGVFASRSTFRPNGLGLSLVKLEGIDTTAPDSPVLMLGGLDLLDGTPVYDVKPYLPYAEAVPEAAAGFAGDAIAGWRWSWMRRRQGILRNCRHGRGRCCWKLFRSTLVRRRGLRTLSEFSGRRFAAAMCVS